MKSNLSRLFALLAIIFIFGSCAKEMPASTEENYTFKAKYNGVLKTFQTRSSAAIYQVNEAYVLSVSASIGNQTSSISLWSKNNSFKSGDVFSNESAGCFSKNSLDYSSNQLSGKEDSFWGSVYIDSELPENFSCKLTEVTAKYIRGTFEADLYNRNLQNPSKMTVRDGEFYVRLQP